MLQHLNNSLLDFMIDLISAPGALLTRTVYRDPEISRFRRNLICSSLKPYLEYTIVTSTIAHLHSIETIGVAIDFMIL